MSRYALTTFQGRFAGLNRFRTTTVQVPIKYAAGGPGEPADTLIDFSPVRVTNSMLDGWRASVGDNHYALGIPGPDAPGDGRFEGLDGTFGFGGRQGQHWLTWRVVAFMHFHWPTRTPLVLSDTPDYNRTNLTLTPFQIDVQGIAVDAGADVDWSSVFTTPGAGQVDLQWIIRGDRVKERIVVNQAARSWLFLNRGITWARTELELALGEVPGTRAGEPPVNFYFATLIAMDWTDIPRRLRSGELLGDDDDFEGDAPIVLQDAAQNALLTLPISRAEVDTTPRGANRDPVRDQFEQPLRVRHWRVAPDNFLAVGLDFVSYNAMVAGPFVFDPQVTDAFTQDGYWDGTTWNEGSVYVEERGSGGNDVAGQRSDVSGEGITNGANCTAADVGATTTYDGGATDVHIRVSDDPASTALSSANNHTTFTQVGSDEDYQIPTSGAWESNDTGNLAAALQSLFQSAGWPGDENIVVWLYGNAAGSNFVGLGNNGLNIDFFWEAAGGLGANVVRGGLTNRPRVVGT